VNEHSKAPVSGTPGPGPDCLSVLERFEAAWQAGTAPVLDEFCSTILSDRLAGDARRALLEEFVKIDLEYRWRSAKPKQTVAAAAAPPGTGNQALPFHPLLEDYAACYPALGPVERLSGDLIAEEYRVRQRWGDRPDPAGYAARFPAQADGLTELFARVDAELAAEKTCRPEPANFVVRAQLPGVERTGPRGGWRSSAGATSGPGPDPSPDRPQSAERHPDQYRTRSSSGTPAPPYPRATENTLDEPIPLAPAQAPDELGRLGPYRVLQVLGTGGMGVVFLAEDPHLRRHVALKTMKPTVAAAGSARQRFLREARAAAGIKHDHVVTIHQVGEEGGVPYLAMELLEGESLEQRLRHDRELPVKDVLHIGRQIAEGLAAAHERGLIHRDLKPANIWLETRREGRGAKGEALSPASPSLPASGTNPVAPPRPSVRVKLIDFGLARGADDGQLTQEGVIVGTPAYMAPEQAKGEAVDARCDLFSLGCVLYRMCTGELPFQGTNAMSILLALLQATPCPVRQLNRAVPPALAELIDQLLAKRPEERPESARAVAETFARLEQEVAQLARPPRRWPVAVAAGLLGLAAAGLLATIIVKITRKDGTVIEIPIQPGDKIELVERPQAATPTVERAEKGSGDNRIRPSDGPHVRPVTAAPVAVVEPPPLAEWLKGRKVLTVAQDGTGQYRTIQAALDALQPGQVVQVLDRGPYRESLTLENPPADVGLISNSQTILEVGATSAYKPSNGEVYDHRLHQVRGFRLSGFALRYREQTDRWVKVLYCSRPRGLVVEDCSFARAPTTQPGKGAMPLALTFYDEDVTEPAVVRECQFTGGAVSVNGVSAAGPVLFERNYFSETSFISLQGRLRKAVVRHCIFEAREKAIQVVNPLRVPEALEFSNNTVPKAEWNQFFPYAPWQGVTLRNNILGTGFRFHLGAAKDLPDVQKNWQVGQNAYASEPADPDCLPRQPGDLPVGWALSFLSVDPPAPDYLRIPITGLLATGGTGGAWPGYVGALPPGLAPKEGDWFTRLRQRWPVSGLPDRKTPPDRGP
jgi:serine/threonine protein kinase